MDKIIIVFATKWFAQKALQMIGNSVSKRFSKTKKEMFTKQEDMLCLPVFDLEEENEFVYIKKCNVNEMLEDTLLNFFSKYHEMQEENKDLKLEIARLQTFKQLSNIDK